MRHNAATILRVFEQAPHLAPNSLAEAH